MPGLENPDVVDLVAFDPAGRVLVVMFEFREWGADEAQMAQLKAKVNAYVAFITDGSLVRHYPDTAGRPVDIQLNCASAPIGQFGAVVEETRHRLALWNIGFRLYLQPDLGPGN